MKLKNISGNTYEFEIGNLLEDELIEDFEQLLKETADRHEKINLLAHISDFPSFKKFRAWRSLGKVKLSAWRKVNRYALVSNEKWVERLFPLAEFISLGITLKLFHESEYKDAIAWVGEEDKAEIKAEDFFTEVEIEKERGTNIYKMVIDGKVDEVAIQLLYKIIDELPEGEKVRILVQIKEFDGLDKLKTYLKGLYLDFKLIGKMDKYAIVADDDWENWIKVADFITPGLEIKAFEEDEKEQALSWLKA
ncbi:MAG: STAS/SEC14 domain-containing protein [Vicingaceae bacterium]